MVGPADEGLAPRCCGALKERVNRLLALAPFRSDDTDLVGSALVEPFTIEKRAWLTQTLQQRRDRIAVAMLRAIESHYAVGPSDCWLTNWNRWPESLGDVPFHD